jgi:hypothetical protein
VSSNGDDDWFEIILVTAALTVLMYVFVTIYLMFYASYLVINNIEYSYVLFPLLIFFLFYGFFYGGSRLKGHYKYVVKGKVIPNKDLFWFGVNYLELDNMKNISISMFNVSFLNIIFFIVISYYFFDDGYINSKEEFERIHGTYSEYSFHLIFTSFLLFFIALIASNIYFFYKRKRIVEYNIFANNYNYNLDDNRDEKLDRKLKKLEEKNRIAKNLIQLKKEKERKEQLIREEQERQIKNIERIKEEREALEIKKLKITRKINLLLNEVHIIKERNNILATEVYEIEGKVTSLNYFDKNFHREYKVLIDYINEVKKIFV